LCLVLLVSTMTITTTMAQDGVDDDRETVVPIDRFMLRLGPRSTEFDLQEKVTVLWEIENLVREYFEEAFQGSSTTLFEEAGITGLSMVPEEDDSELYETVKFLGGAVTFDADSMSVPTSSEVQTLVANALDSDAVIGRLSVSFPELSESTFIPLELGNRGFGPTAGTTSPNENDGDNTMMPQTYDKPKVPQNNTINSEINGAASESISSENVSVGKTTIGLSAGVALGGAIICLLVGLLLESRRRRMEFWREAGRDSSSSNDADDDEDRNATIIKNPANKGVYAQDEQEPSLRLPRLWGVTPSRPMEAMTSPGSSEMSASNKDDEEGDSVQEILTCTSMDRRSIQNVESFEHQKRLVDTLKKEMMASNAEIHPYLQAQNPMDHTEPCALSPTDLSAAALENPTQFPFWPPAAAAASDAASSISESGGEEVVHSSTSPLHIMMRNLQLPGSKKSQHTLPMSNQVEF